MATARELLSTWISKGYKETQYFNFRGSNGNVCEASFADVMPLFTQPDLWYESALACDTCHNSDLSKAAARLDMSSYGGILAGGKRPPSSAQGEDILGGGNWEQSILNKVLFVDGRMPFGHPLGAVAPDGPTIQAGSLVNESEIAPTPIPSESEITRPSNPGGTGEATGLTGDPVEGEIVYQGHCQVCHGAEGKDEVLNPGSDDGTVPALNPIDATMVSKDYKIFVFNLDLFLQNGSIPMGVNPAFRMPAWGERGALTQQQIADVIAYIISLNQ
jgi:mono/diheme cytochrome c family protein